jgi:hypothetical protein
MATLISFILLIATFKSTVHIERIVVFQWQQWLRDCATLLNCVYMLCVSWFIILALSILPRIGSCFFPEVTVAGP